MYTDYFLKFADQAEADGVLFDEETVVQDDVVETIKKPRYTAIDIIGTIYKPTGKVLPAPDGSGDAVDEMAPIDGWHVNVRHMGEALKLAPFQVYPATPVRMWA